VSLERLASKYIATAEQVFTELQVTDVCVNVDVADVREVLESARAYLKDAKYYRDKGKFEVSLTSIAYCEGLLDALRLLGAVKFEWPAKRKPEK
jgi:hypothetical protein